MAESIGLIERAAALLRQREAADLGSPPAPKPSTPTPAATSAPPAPQPAGRSDTAAAGSGLDLNGAETAAGSGPLLILDRGRLADHGVTVPSSERSRTVEEFRLVKRNLMAAWSASTGEDQRESRLIMVTSARPGEGKTFVSLNLALAFASERDVKALLVDVDTHHSTLRTILGIPGEAGIVDVVAGDLDLARVLVRTSYPNLLVLPAGRGGPHVPELFSSNRMGALLTELTRRFPDRFIILDTPPCMASSDAATLAPLVGQIVFVVEAHRTQQDEIEAGLGMLGSCPRISLLLNKGESASAHFGSYGYGYHYPDGEGDELRSDAPAPA
ncbi:MAG TPA: AAA family ATPase [Stellaceae bacterium]|jgi:receptor protein-tyrosine kinase